jgi:5-methylcytosine-specific restriction endonuclease McrA
MLPKSIDQKKLYHAFSAFAMVSSNQQRTITSKQYQILSEASKIALKGNTHNKGKVRTSELTLDHVIPKSQGGKTTWANVCACCKECNSKKGNDHTVVPKKTPHKPSYYEILSKRKNLPIHVRDEDWKFYLDWPEDLINVIPKSKEID